MSYYQRYRPEKMFVRNAAMMTRSQNMGSAFWGLLRTLHLLLLRNGNQPTCPKRYQEYKQQKQSIISSPGRIHRRVTARHESARMKSECLLT